MRSPELIQRIQDSMTLLIESSDELRDLDQVLGDGDLGLTMSKGYGSLPDIMRTEAEGAAGDIGKLLMKSGMKMSSLVPSTMGFLMSTGIMKSLKRKKRNRCLWPCRLSYRICSWCTETRQM